MFIEECLMPIDLIMIKKAIGGRARSLTVGTMSLLWQRILLFDEPFSISRGWYGTMLKYLYEIFLTQQPVTPRDIYDRLF